MSKSQWGLFCWSELATTNVSLAKEFYTKVLGWQFVDHEMGDMTYTMITNGEQEFAGMWQIPSEMNAQIPPHWMSYISVEDLHETLDKAQRAGATIKMPVTKAGNFGEFAIIIDPTGAHIAFWQSNEAC